MVLEEINRIRKALVSEAELADAKSYLIGSFPLRLDTNRKIASILSSVEFYGLGLDYFETYPRRIDSVSREEVLKMARKHLNPKNYVLVIVGKPDASRLP
jgi:zinc protease